MFELQSFLALLSKPKLSLDTPSSLSLSGSANGSCLGYITSSSCPLTLQVKAHFNDALHNAKIDTIKIRKEQHKMLLS